ncbi:MAG: LacI family transcriptional regulator [Armatimonadetes bacterium]|nr:LacI family transcriptional regulator [Armatimonadota bacterium]
MKRRVRASDVAQMAGVSTATVSLVLSGRHGSRVSPQTRERVLNAALKLGYQPDPLARALSTGKTHSIALWTYGVYDAYYSQAVWLFQELLNKDNYEVQLVETDELVDENATWRNSALWPVDGILAFESPMCVDAYLQTSPEDRKPTVSAGAFWSDKTDYVGVDLLSGTVSVIRHLLENGNRRIAWLGPSSEAWMGEPRQVGYVSVMKDAGLPTEFIYVPVESATEFRRATYENIDTYLEKNGCPEAIFCAADEMMIGALRRLHERGIRVPEDVALAGCDGIPETEYHEPRLSTLATPIEQVCRIAWEFLRRRIENPNIDRQGIVLQPQLVIRESSDYLRR